MVKHSPSVAKICLIHGPPGTGKSKTIVGLLYRLLTEVGVALLACPWLDLNYKRHVSIKVPFPFICVFEKLYYYYYCF